MSNHTTMDKIALYIGGGLVVLGTFVIGLVEMLAGSTHPVTSDGQIPHDAIVPPDIRAYIILLGLLIWGIYALYTAIATTPGRTSMSSL